jgi:D-alanyl-lipoteichoic acid acyltransferase DltB (MBOAT superfamily)
MNGAFLMLLLLSCFANYGFGLLVNQQNSKRLWLVISISFNLLVLAYFKYAHFFVDSLNLLFDTKHQVFNWMGWLFNQLANGALDEHSILLPIGISFYTFQAISYLVDVSWGKTSAVRNPLDFSFYLSFFPQLVAGPIVRASSFIPQLYQRFSLKKEAFSHAIYLIAKGLFKKMVIADFLALNFIDRVFEAPLSYSGLENIFAVYAYSVQIYCDFSGYTDIAIGLALVLGFKIPVNFNAPYQATSLTGFWRRWHISLSLWLRDYLYIPLGGNRKGQPRMYANILITMVLGGLWHGANFRFIIWGAVHGLALVAEKFFGKIFVFGPKLHGWKKILAIFFTFQLVSFAWLFFRANGKKTIMEFFYQVQHHFIPEDFMAGWENYQAVAGILLLGFILIWFPHHLKEKLRGHFIGFPMVLQMVLAVGLLLIVTWVSQTALQPFIYFRF